MKTTWICTGTTYHAVGPDYRDGRSEEEMYLCDQQLESAYACSMQLALEKRIEYLAFPLLSAGVFKGRRPIEAVLRIAVDTIWEKLEFAHSDVAADGPVTQQSRRGRPTRLETLRLCSRKFILLVFPMASGACFNILLRIRFWSVTRELCDMDCC